MPGLANYAIIAILIVVVTVLATVILVLTHLIGPRRGGAIKHSAYESGVDPIGDTRRRFNVRFYLVAVLFLVFDVEIIFLYPWAVIYPHLRPGLEAYRSQSAAALAPQSVWAGQLYEAGFTPAFFAVGIGLFFVLLTAGFLYEWRKGIFKWD